MIREVKTFIAALEAADKAYRDRGDEIRRTRFSTSTDEYYARQRENTSAHRAARDAAWGPLAASEDKLVAFMGTNCRDYPGEVILILGRLPLTMAELRKLSDDQDWCGTFDSFMEDAQDAGCFPEQPLPEYTPAVMALRRWFRDEITTDNEMRRQLGEKVAAVVAEATGIPDPTDIHPADFLAAQ